MENFDEEWMAEFKRQVEQDILYWPLEQEMAVVRNAYCLMREELTPKQCETLDQYFYLSKQMEIALTRSAYVQGMLHGRKHTKP